MQNSDAYAQILTANGSANAHFVHEGIQKKYFLQIHDNGANGDEGDGYDHGDDRRGLHLIPSFYLFKAFCLLFAEIGANVGIRLVQARHRFRRLFRGDLPRLIVERRMGSILIIGKIFRARLYHAEPAAPIGGFQLDRAQVCFFRAAELAQRKEDVSAADIFARFRSGGGGFCNLFQASPEILCPFSHSSAKSFRSRAPAYVRIGKNAARAPRGERS